MGHWYKKDGSPAHYEGKNGGDTTLREARKLELFPSVTTIGGVRHKQGLVTWLQQEAAMTAAMTMLEEGLDALNIDRPWASQQIAKAKEQTTAKADAGTEIHDKLEKFQEDPFSLSPEDQKMCFAIADCIKENTGLSLYEDFIPEARFCNTEIGYGGTCDLHTQLVTEPWVIDYKSKDEVTPKTRGYEEQAEQLAAYANGLGIASARTANLFISRNPPEGDEPWGVKFYEHKDKMAWARFQHTTYLWQIMKKYGPYYEAYIKEIEDDS